MRSIRRRAAKRHASCGAVLCELPMSAFPPVRPAPRSVPLEVPVRFRLARAGVGLGAGWSWRRRADEPQSLWRLALGIVAIGAGVSFVLRSGLGANSWDVFAVGLADATGLSLTVILWGCGGTNLVLAMLLGRRPGWTTLVPTLVYGPVIPLGLALTPTPEGLVPAMGLFAAGFALMALGSGVYLSSGCRPGPTDLLFHGLADHGLRPWQARLSVEGSVLLTGVLLGGPVGVGTAILTVGLAFTIPATVDALEVVLHRRATAAAVPEPAEAFAA